MLDYYKIMINLYNNIALVASFNYNISLKKEKEYFSRYAS